MMTTATWAGGVGAGSAGATAGALRTTSGAHAGSLERGDARLYRMPKRTAFDWGVLAALLAASCAAFFVNLTASGYANEFYSAAAQAGATDWESFLWGSLDSGNAITVDKPPAALWLMAISVRIFGLSSFSILLPQALMGVAVTYLLYATVRRYWGNRAGVAAGAVFALTPVAALMFRFNNPDALLVLLMTGAAYAVLRSLEYAPSRKGNRLRTWWMVFAGVLIGFGFLTKQLQVLLVLPGFAVAFLLASPTKALRRVVDGLAATAAMIVSAGWWVLLTVLVPSGSRPYIGGSQNDSFIELTFGYNGFGRLTGSEEGSVVPGGGGGGGMWGQTGWTRLFTGEYATQIAWLAPLAFAGVVIGIVAIGRASRIDIRRASILVFGGWLVVTWLVFSFMAGIFHQYYTVALSPALAVMAVIAATGLWLRRYSLWARIATPLLVLVSTFWAFHLIGLSSWLPWLKWAVLAAGTLGGVGIALAGLLASQRMELVSVVVSVIALMAGPTAWTLYTIGTGHTGSIVLAGPNVTSSTGMGGGPGGGGFGGGMPGGGFGAGAGANGTSNDGQSGEGTQSNMPALPQGGTDATGNDGTMGQPPQNQSGESTQAGGMSGGQGGGLTGSQASTEVVALLTADAGTYRWAAATTGSQNAAGYQLASQQAVMAIGGFNGSDPAPTLDQFKSYVEQGLIHYYIAGGGMGGTQMGGSDAASQISSWVEEHFTSTTVDGVTVYDLTTA